MISKLLAAWGGALTLLILPSVAVAAPVTWTVPATVLPDGATISGSFVYDTATLSIVSANITQTGVDPGTYSVVALANGPYRMVQRTPTAAIGDTTFWVRVDGIPPAGGPFVAPQIGTGGCIHVVAGKCDNAEVANRVNGLNLSGVSAPTAVPTMTEWAMILLGLMLAGFAALTIQRRRATV